MKRIFAAALATLTLLLLFTACGKTPSEAPVEGAVKPGEKVEVNYYLTETENIACYNLLIDFDRDNLEYVTTRPSKAEGLEYYAELTDDGVKLAYYTATVADLGDAPAATVVFRVKESCTEKKLVTTMTATGILKGLDPRGDSTEELDDEEAEVNVFVDLG